MLFAVIFYYQFRLNYIVSGEFMNYFRKKGFSAGQYYCQRPFCQRQVHKTVFGICEVCNFAQKHLNKTYLVTWNTKGANWTFWPQVTWKATGPNLTPGSNVTLNTLDEKKEFIYLYLYIINVNQVVLDNKPGKG